jgi:hypothetical protein
MATNDTSSILDGLLFTAMNKWDMSEEQILENMNKIAFHESKLDPSAVQKVDPETAEDGSTVWGVGKGKGLFQFESGENQGAHTAINRLMKELGGYEPEFLTGLSESGYNISDLSPEEQQAIFLGNLLQKPNVEGRTPASFKGIDTDEELAEFWAQHHHAGTEPGTEEYKTIINKFLEDIAYYK